MNPIRSIAVSALLLAAMPAGAADGVRVSAAELTETARAAVLAKASEAGVQVDVEVAGRVQDLQLRTDAPESPSVTAGRWQEPWLRPRIGVPVHAEAGGKRATATVWLAVSAPAQGEVYMEGFARGAPAETLRCQSGRVDLARSQGKKTVVPASMLGMRLRRAVRAGDPVLASDFEAVPTVSAQQTVSVQATRGAVSLSVPGRALGDGDAGQTISVLPSNATRPVRARVVSPGVVTLED